MDGGETVTAQWEIRIARTREAGTVRHIRLEALLAEPSAYASQPEDIEALSQEDWRRQLDGLDVVLALVDDHPVGMMALRRHQRSKTAHRAALTMAYVRADWRGTGIAAAMLNSLLALAVEQGIRQVEAAAYAESPAALRFYTREGFAVVGCVPGGFLHDGREIDEYLLARRIA